jgi:hypothetical protein
MATKQVLPGGKVRFRGLVYQDDHLLPLVGQQVKLGRDRSIDDADACIFDLDGVYVCQASNTRKWELLLEG